MQNVCKLTSNISHNIITFLACWCDPTINELHVTSFCDHKLEPQRIHIKNVIGNCNDRLLYKLYFAGISTDKYSHQDRHFQSLRNFSINGQHLHFPCVHVSTIRSIDTVQYKPDRNQNGDNVNFAKFNRV